MNFWPKRHPTIKTLALSFLISGFWLFVFTGKAYQWTVIRSRETMLKEDLLVMRKAIDQYTTERQVPPRSLRDLVDAHYLNDIPRDSVTDKKDWVFVLDSANGFADVHSASPKYDGW